MWRGLVAVSVGCVIAGGLAPVAWSAPTAPASADTPVADGAAEPTTDNAPLSAATVQDPGASVAASSGSTLSGVPSRVLPTGEARMVGVTWPGAAPQVVELRSQNLDGSWTPWVQVDAAISEDNGEAKGSDPVWIGASRNVEVKAARDGQDAGAELTAVLVKAPTTETEAELDTDPNALAKGRDAGVAGSEVAAALPVPVISRAAWGANESWRSGSPGYHGGVRAATIHHTASTNNYTRSSSPAQVRAFYSYHTRTLGWSDIGYNVLVDKYGQVFEGRAGGLSRPVMGAHAGGFNRHTFGVSMIGNYATATPPAPMVENVSQIIAWKFRISGIGSGRGTARIVSEAGNVKYPRGATATLPRIFAHRDVGYTTCPGNAGYAKMETIRARVTTLLSSGGSRPPAPSAPPVQVTSMASGASVASSGGAYHLTMQGDGNLVIYARGGRAVWSSQTYLPGGRLLVQGDGNVVIVDRSGRPRWHTNSAGRRGARFMLQGDGNLVLYSGSTPVWDRMWRSPGRERRHQTDFTAIHAPGHLPALTGAHSLVLQRDGNLVVYASGNRPVWATNTRGSRARLRMQGDGNLVLTNGAGQVMWHSGTFGRPGARAVIADDGKLSVYHGNARVWAS